MDPSQSIVATTNVAVNSSLDLTYSSFMVILALVFVLLNGFFVLSEFSIIKVRRSKLEEFVKEKKSKC